ncbi:MAG: flippase-like domain-containing protein, partial [Lachnospiraceae bacterium]|nr:flippase-like domain-containing protein [Lachnospiraceae bacterium]
MKIWKSRSVWIGATLLILLSAATLFIIYRELNGKDIIGTIKRADPFWVIAAFIFMILYFVADGINIRRSLRLTGYDISISQMMTYAYAGFFFSYITPSSTGGQPGQLYFMYRDRIRLSHGTFSLLCVFLSYQIMAVLWGIIGVLYLRSEYVSINGRFAYVFPIGFALNILIILFGLCVLFSKKLTKAFAHIALEVVKRYGKKDYRASIFRFFALYRNASGLIKKNKIVYAKVLITSFIQLTLFHSIPFLCVHALGCSKPGLIKTLCTQGALFLSVSSLPLPG